MSNLPPLPVLCDTPPPIDDFSNIPDDDYVDFDGIGDDYDGKWRFFICMI